MNENDIARVIFANLFPRGMCPADWDSGAVLGHNNETREQFLSTARALLAFATEQDPWPSPEDAAIKACALMIKGICLTKPQDEWTAQIEKRIRFMLNKGSK